MNTIIDLFTDYTFQIVAIGTGMLGLLSGVVGTFANLRKESLLGDALSHAALPGIVIAFMIIGYKEWLILLLGATISGILATGIIRWMSGKEIKLDNALSLILSSFFGLGLVLLTETQKWPNANQAGLDNFIYGQASAMLQRDVIVIALVGVVILAIIFLFWKEFKLFTFDREYAEVKGFNTKLLQFLLSTMLVVVIILGLESVGVILMSALLIAPPVAARQWTNRLSTMVFIAAIIGMLSGIFGTLISSLGTQLPTGPTISVIATVMAFLSVLLAPKRGVLSQKLRLRKDKKIFRQQLLDNDQIKGVK